MPLDADACYRALTAKDGRFDGLFFVGVSSTGIYCRCICPARAPARVRCAFFRTAVEAEQAGYRACRRCRPERAPGGAPVDALSRTVSLAMGRIAAGALQEGSLDDVARDLGITTRHLRRAMNAELGLSPITLAQSRRLALAKQLLQDTRLSMTDVAFASGFQSVRRFNALFKAAHGCAPSALRRERAGGDLEDPEARESFSIVLEYRPPLAWEPMLAFLSARAIAGVEVTSGQSYARTVRLGEARGWIRVRPIAGRPALQAEISRSLVGSLLPLVAQLRHLFDLDAHPWAIAEHLGADPRLAPLLVPGLRVPHAADGFEVACRAILGQQVSVAAARTLAGRLVEAFGEPLDTPITGLTHLSPSAEHLARAGADAIAQIGLQQARARTLADLAEAAARKEIALGPAADPAELRDKLLAIRGIGPWTADYLAMRALGDPDAFPASDLGIRKALGGATARQASELAGSWRPWRSYAVMALWRSLA